MITHRYFTVKLQKQYKLSPQTQVRASLVSKSGRYLLNVTKPNPYSGALTLKVFDLGSFRQSSEMYCVY